MIFNIKSGLIIYILNFNINWGENVMREEIILNKSLDMAIHAKCSIYRLFKRLIDIIFGFLGFILLIPITIILKICSIVTKDYKSIFYTQNRIGLNGKEFKLYKFRSMVPNADIILDNLLKNNPELRKEYNINKKLKDDPRLTKLGKFIRRTSIDELPQFINILLGDMTLIGNRPYLPREKKDMGKSYKKIISTKPGLTGYWQVSGRSNTSFKDRLKLESYYSDHCSFTLDVKIFFKTFKVVLFGKGAE